MKTITTIELSNICNLSCRYCINRLLVKHPSRYPGIMIDHTFDAALEVLKQLCNNGTQREIYLNGNGESTLDKNLAKRISAVKNIVGDRTVGFCTNAVGLSRDMIESYLDAGIDRIDLSIHSPYDVRRVSQYFIELGTGNYINVLAFTRSHNWAGQLEKEHTIETFFIPKTTCTPIDEQRGYIQKEGYVSPCCYDYRNLGVFGSVFDADIIDREIKGYSLCKQCHEKEQNNAI